MYNCGGRFLAICELNVKEKLPWPTWQISICKPTVTINVESVFFSTSAGLQTQINIYSSNKTVSLLALWGGNAELMDIWLVCVCVCWGKCLRTVCIYMMVMYLQNISTMCMCMPVPLAEDSEFWAFAMLSQQGARATLERTDGLNSPSP